MRPFTVQLQFVRTSWKRRFTVPSLRPITSMFGFSTAGMVLPARLVGSFADTSKDNPPSFLALAAFTKDVTEDVCGLER